MQISKRLEAVAAMVTSGRKIADVGTDHAYIPIELVKRGVVPSAVAMDVNRGPLRKAEENIRQCGLEQKIETRLSDGLAALAPGEVQSIIIAGMGGPLTIRILQEGAGKLAGCRELILQPQSEIRLVRAYLEDQGWTADREEMILEEGKYYPMMHVVLPQNQGEICCSEEKLSPVQLRYGPLLLAEHHPVLHEFLLREQNVNRRILESLDRACGEAAVRRRHEVEQELKIVEEALSHYYDR